MGLWPQRRATTTFGVMGPGFRQDDTECVARPDIHIVNARSEATKQSIAPHMWRNGLLRFARNDAGHTASFSRHDLPELCLSFHPQSRGRRESRVHAAPAVSRARVERMAH